MAIIHLDGNRREYFSQTSLARLRKAFPRVPRTVKNLADLEELVQEGLLVPAATERSAWRKRHHSNYSYINLMSAAVKRRVLRSQDVPDGVLPAYVISQGFGAKRLLSIGTDILRERGAHTHTVLGYRWNNQYVTWSELLFGSVARAHQNAVFWSRYPLIAEELKKHSSGAERAQNR